MRLKRLGLYVSGVLGLALMVACSAGDDETTGESEDAVSIASSSRRAVDPNHPSFIADRWIGQLQNARVAGGDRAVADVLQQYVASVEGKPADEIAKLASYASILDPANAQLALAGLLHKLHRFEDAVKGYDKAIALGPMGVADIDIVIFRAEASSQMEPNEGMLVEDDAKRARFIAELVAAEAAMAGKPGVERLTYKILLGETISGVQDLRRTKQMLDEVDVVKTEKTVADRAFAGTKLHLARKQFQMAGLTRELDDVRLRIERFDSVFETDFAGVHGGKTLLDDDD